MTSVEWLVEQLSNYDSKMVELFDKEINQAEEMEKQQHYETWFQSTAQFSNEAEMLYKKDFEQYYNKTFKNK